MAAKTRLGFIGLGQIARMHWEHLVTRGDVELTAFCDIDESRLHPPASQYGARAFTDYKRMLEDTELEAIYICVPPYVDGEIEGTVEVQEHRLTVGPNGKVKATINARDVVVRGTVHGNIEAGEKIDIRKEAKVVGDLRTTRIVVEDGAYLKGAVDIVRQEVTRKPPETKPAPPPPKPEPPRQQTLTQAARHGSEK